MTSATLLIETHDRLTPFAIDDAATIGRDPKCAISIDHPTVSRAHARIERDGDRWRFVDLSSSNGSTLGNARVSGSTSLADRAALRIGRVRAWFFVGDVPAGWSPSADVELYGKLVRCRCGYIGWVPSHAAGMRLPCPKCKRDIVINDLPAAADAASTAPGSAATATQTCAACHTPIAPGEEMHTCPSCESTMHIACWKENRGCASYGCDQVNILDAQDDVESTDPSTTDAATDLPTDGAQDAATADVDADDPRVPATTVARRALMPERLRKKLAKYSLVALLGLPTFGVPGIGLAAYEFVGESDALHADESRPTRLGRIVLTMLAGVIGFATSVHWYFGI